MAKNFAMREITRLPAGVSSEMENRRESCAMRRARSIAVAGLAGWMTACAGAPPPFAIELDDAARAEPGPGASPAAPSIYVGPRATPPPGEYRSARVFEDGRVDAREVFAVDGPGPWLTYEGRTAIAPEMARDALRAAEAAAADAPPARGSHALSPRARVERRHPVAGMRGRGARAARARRRAASDAGRPRPALRHRRLSGSPRPHDPAGASRPLRPRRARPRLRSIGGVLVRHARARRRRHAECPARRPRTRSADRCRRALLLADGRCGGRAGSREHVGSACSERRLRSRRRRRVESARTAAGDSGQRTVVADVRRMAFVLPQVTAGRDHGVKGGASGAGAPVNFRMSCSTSSDQAVCVSWVRNAQGNASG